MSLQGITKIIFGLALLLLSALPGAYAKAAEPTSQKAKIGIFVFWLDDIYINLVTQAVQKHIAGKAELTIFDAKQDQVLQKSQLATFIAEGGQAVAVNLVDVKFGQSIVNVVNKKDIPIIFFNKQPDFDSIKNYDLARYVGSVASQSGILQGEVIAEIWKENPSFDRNNDGICNFIMLQGNIDNPEALARSRVSVQRARAMGVNMQQIGDTLICDWDAECAYDRTKLALDLYSEQLDFIIANNDGMALGAIKSLQEQGFNLEGGSKHIPVVGIDGVEDAKKAIAKGIMHGTVIQDADAMGEAVATMLLNSIAKKPFLEGLPYKWNDDEIAIGIPYRVYEVE